MRTESHNRAFVQMPRGAQVLAALLFAIGMLVVIAHDAPRIGALLIVAAAVFWLIATRAFDRQRVGAIYALLARIGEGELGASQPDSPDEHTLRLQRGIARAQRGFGEALARAELERDDLRTLIGTIRTGLIALDGELRIRSANAVALTMFELTTTDCRGRLLAEVIRQPELLQFVEEARRTGTPTIREITLTGSAVERVTAVADPVRALHGAAGGLLLAFDDVTKLRRLETVRIDFAASVSHELRTPITNIKGYLETLIELGADDPEQVAHFLAVIHRNTSRLSTLVEDLLLLAFLDQPRAGSQLEFTEAALFDIARDAAAQLEVVAAAKQMTIENRIDRMLHARVNPSLLCQALLNLMSNALSFAPTGTRVIVDAHLDEGHLHITVADSGPGIDPVHLPRIFERFYRVDKARTRELGGTGLGLSIVKHIAMVHGGTVEVRCPSTGGTVFTVSIPRGYRKVDPA